ncbi:helix-turn-helix domain-containing protein [Kitasatospora kifunensis]|uniref:Transcriptional regulator with XRE-family HTH domain n=1 Tax=Kitasatospora kifunensis TaxID=58351 RepID=A0A7W7QXD6_KITKI|nr:helix-turn-helix transcriptional regulator [Kitasatospora kifunensis]MBB4921459.1 transcriptional regulator with XRE-family HTH domain [Kitasatospora kifunensis]
MAYKGEATIRKRILGGRLRRIREERNISIEDVAAQLGVGHSTVRRQESGHTAVSVADAGAYCRIYQVTDERLHDELLDMAKHSRGTARGWWAPFGSKIGPTARDVADAEDLATEIRTFQPLVIPGLLQTRDYTAAILKVAGSVYEEEDYPFEEFLAFRERRKALLNAPKAPRLWVIFGEAAVLTPVGGAQVMRDQIQHLLNLGERRNINLQMLPFAAGEHVGLTGAFVLMSFADNSAPALTYFESTNAFNDDPEDVKLNAERFDQLRLQCQPAAETRGYLLNVLSNC